MRRALPYLAVLAVVCAGVGYSVAGNVSLGSHVGDYRAGFSGGVVAGAITAGGGVESTGTGTCSGADSVVFDKNGTNRCPPASDAAPLSMSVSPGDAWAQATTNTTGADLRFGVGIGRRIYTLVDYSTLDTGVDTFTITRTCGGTSTATVLTAVSGTPGAGEFKFEVSNAQTAINLAAAIAALSNLTGTVAVTDTVRVQVDFHCTRLITATSAAAGEATTTMSTDGTFKIASPNNANDITFTVTGGALAIAAAGGIALNNSGSWASTVTLGNSSSTVTLGSLIITQEDVGATCTTGAIRLDTAGAKELCYCQTTNTWYCWTATTLTGPTD